MTLKVTDNNYGWLS